MRGGVCVCECMCVCIYSSQIGNAVETREPPRDCGWKEGRKRVPISVHPQQGLADVWMTFLECLLLEKRLFKVDYIPPN